MCLLGVLVVFGAGCLGGSSSGKKLGDDHDFGDNDPDVVVAMGDSITAGGFSGGAPWPARLAGMIGKNVVNQGIPGVQSTVGAARVNGVLGGRKPGFVIICYGSNDAIRGTPAGITEANLRAMVAATKANQSIPLLSTIPPMIGSRTIYNSRIDTVNAVIRTIASGEEVTLVDVHRAVRQSPATYLVDGLHLSDRGEELVALEFLDAFKSSVSSRADISRRARGPRS